MAILVYIVGRAARVSLTDHRVTGSPGRRRYYHDGARRAMAGGNISSKCRRLWRQSC